MSRPRRSGWLRPDFPAPNIGVGHIIVANEALATGAVTRHALQARYRKLHQNVYVSMDFALNAHARATAGMWRGDGHRRPPPWRPRHPSTTQGTRACRRGSRIPRRRRDCGCCSSAVDCPDPSPRSPLPTSGDGFAGGSIWAGSTGTWVLNTTANSTGPAPRTTRTTSSGWNSWHPAAGRSCGSAPGSFGIGSLRSWLESGAL